MRGPGRNAGIAVERRPRCARPWSRVEETAGVLAAMGAKVTTRRYPGKPHSVSAEKVELARALIAGAFA